MRDFMNLIYNNIIALLTLFLVNIGVAVISMFGSLSGLLFIPIIPIIICYIIIYRLSGVVLEDFGTTKNNIKHTALVLIFIVIQYVASYCSTEFGISNNFFQTLYLLTRFASSFLFTGIISIISPAGETYEVIRILNVMYLLIEYVFILKGMERKRKVLEMEKRE